MLPTLCTKVAPLGLHLWPGFYSEEAFIWKKYGIMEFLESKQSFTKKLKDESFFH